MKNPGNRRTFNRAASKRVRGDADEWITCLCGKRGYRERSQARKARRRSNTDARVYACTMSGYWHLGHLPRDIIRGRVTRADVYGDAA